MYDRLRILLRAEQGAVPPDPLRSELKTRALSTWDVVGHHVLGSSLPDPQIASRAARGEDQLGSCLTALRYGSSSLTRAAGARRLGGLEDDSYELAILTK